jgi:uncharacterized protein (DUF58 family)
MRNVAGLAITLSAAFMAVVAVMLDAPSMFYMGTALVATIGSCRLQSWLAVRGLRFERVAPESARVGDLVTVEITCWSERRIRRPLVTVYDKLPPRMLIGSRSPSLPIAPAYDLPVRTQYQFRPLKRGRYRWSGVIVEGTDALGLVTRTREYETAMAETTVLPRPIPVSIEMPTAAGWGISEAESGQTRGAGIEPRGVREFVHGDSLRHVHWRSTAKTGRLLVKEFEAGTHAAAAFVIQSTEGSEVGEGANTSLELMVGHAVFLAEQFLRQGARVEFPGLEERGSHHSVHERTNEIYEVLAGVQAESSTTISAQVAGAADELPPGSVLFVMLAASDPELPAAFAALQQRGTRVVPLLYDADAFRNRRKVPSATHPDFVRALRSVGAHPIVMPTDGAVLEEKLDEGA